MTLNGKSVLVTGGGTGLGRAIARAAAKSGANVIINYSRSASDAECTVAELKSLGARAIAVQASVDDPDQAERLVDRAERALGPLCALVNNAGVTRGVPFSDVEAVTPGDWHRTLGVNLLGAWYCSRVAGHRMRTRGTGTILNVASDSAISLSGSSIPYVVSKAALIALTRCMARALAPAVRVNAIAPGWMTTRWLEDNLTASQLAYIRSGAARTTDVNDMAALSIELLRNDSVTGQCLVVDGGDSLVAPEQNKLD
ncbi:MAG TPA: SDR family oxidoreductase [Steroidobacteraceae bacterium]|nr:SDR family oxidoreductase [Steroidobacteraceae bacterium]